MAPKPKKPSTKTSSRLLEVVRFLSLISKDEGPPNETHILLKDRTASAFNGTLGAGVIIEEELYCAPHTKTFLSALSKCGENYSLTQVDQAKLSIKSGPFKAIIPCIDPSLIYFPIPDANVAPIDDSFKISLELIEKIKPENGQRVVTLSFLMNGGSIIATDGKILVEAWHGLNLPTNVPIPKAIIPVLLSSKKLIGFGLSSTTCTFHLEEGKFIRSQLYAEKWPLDILDILNSKATPIPLPAEFWNGFDKVETFSTDGLIYSKNQTLYSHANENAGASYECEGMPDVTFTISQFKLVKAMIEKIDFSAKIKADRPCIMFYGKNVRGVIAGRA